MGKVAKAAGTAAVVGAVAVTAVAIGGGAYLLYKSHESHKQNASTTRLRIRLKDAHNLIAADRGGTSDPYVTIKVAHLKVKSSTKNKTLNPTWNEDYDMGIENRTGKITIKVWDKDLVSDDALGRAEVDLASVPMDYPHEYKLHLTNKKHQGVVNLSMWITNSLSTSDAVAGSAVAPQYPQQPGAGYPPPAGAGYASAYPGAYPPAYGTAAGYPPPAGAGYASAYPGAYPPAYGTAAGYPSPAPAPYGTAAGYPPASYPPPEPYPSAAAYGSAYPAPGGYPAPQYGAAPAPSYAGYPPPGAGSPAACLSSPGGGYPQQSWYPPPQ